MALTPFQRRTCRLLAASRRATADSYVAGGVALGVALRAARLSRDVDVFHDTGEAVRRSSDLDRFTLEQAGYAVKTLRERSGYVEALVSLGRDDLIMEWTQDSAFRFFPLVEDEDLGLMLHPFDLATNKVLALVGRAETRDWIDIIACHDRLQPLGYLVWAACGKDPGFTPAGILEQARRSSRYTDAEISMLAFEGPVPQAADLSRRWRAALLMADTIIAKLPAGQVGQAAITPEGELLVAEPAELDLALARGDIIFHEGRVGGAWPQVKQR